MSRNATPDSPQSEKDAYSRAWGAIQKLLRRGGSESGHERNCCFLNLGAGTDATRGRFATASAATGLDFDDDARGLALCDWNHDGRVDLWITNRTAPRVRLMLNDYPAPGNHWLGLRLHGDGKTVNRDAVGARVEVLLDGAEVPLLRTVSAGSGFLSQSSVWQHIGLGTVGKVLRLTIKWPGGPVEDFSVEQVDAFYDLHMGRGKAARWTPPDKAPALKAPPPSAAAPPASGTRTVLIAPLPVPAAWVPGTLGKRGTVLLLWSATCPQCAAEFKSLETKRKTWAAQGVNISPWCLDATPEAARAVARKAGWTGAVADGGKAGIQAALNAVQQGLCGLQRDLPTPSSFLLDAAGRIVSIYHGRLPAKLEADFSLLAGLPTHRAAASVESAGQWLDPIQGTGLRGPAAILLDEGLHREATELAEHVAAFYAAPGQVERHEQGWAVKEQADAHAVLSLLALGRKNLPAAITHLEQSLARLPSQRVRRELMRLYFASRDRALHQKLGPLLEEMIREDRAPDLLSRLASLHLDLGHAAEALPLLKESAEKLPSARTLHMLGHAARSLGQAKDAAAAWNQALRADDSHLPSLNDLAWLRATHADAALRDGPAALTLARRASELSGGQSAPVLATLAAAAAEAGDFTAAEAAMAKAVALADAAGKQRFSSLLDRLRLKQPIREGP